MRTQEPRGAQGVEAARRLEEEQTSTLPRSAPLRMVEATRSQEEGLCVTWVCGRLAEVIQVDSRRG